MRLATFVLVMSLLSWGTRIHAQVAGPVRFPVFGASHRIVRQTFGFATTSQPVPSLHVRQLGTEPEPVAYGHPLMTCPMPVAPTVKEDPMPIAGSGGVPEPMPVARSGCWNPLGPVP